MTSSRSDFRSSVVTFFILVCSLSILASIDLLLAFEFFNDLVQRLVAFDPQLAIALEPRGLVLEQPRTEPTGPHASHFLSRHETRLLEDAHVLLHARERHVELL